MDETTPPEPSPKGNQPLLTPDAVFSSVWFAVLSMGIFFAGIVLGVQLLVKENLIPAWIAPLSFGLVGAATLLFAQYNLAKNRRLSLIVWVVGIALAWTGVFNLQVVPATAFLFDNGIGLLILVAVGFASMVRAFALKLKIFAGLSLTLALVSGFIIQQSAEWATVLALTLPTLAAGFLAEKAGKARYFPISCIIAWATLVLPEFMTMNDAGAWTIHWFAPALIALVGTFAAVCAVIIVLSGNSEPSPEKRKERSILQAVALFTFAAVMFTAQNYGNIDHTNHLEFWWFPVAAISLATGVILITLKRDAGESSTFLALGFAAALAGVQALTPTSSVLFLLSAATLVVIIIFRENPALELRLLASAVFVVLAVYLAAEVRSFGSDAPFAYFSGESSEELGKPDFVDVLSRVIAVVALGLCAVLIRLDAQTRSGALKYFGTGATWVASASLLLVIAFLVPDGWITLSVLLLGLLLIIAGAVSKYSDVWLPGLVIFLVGLGRVYFQELANLPEKYKPLVALLATGLILIGVRAGFLVHARLVKKKLALQAEAGQQQALQAKPASSAEDNDVK